MATEPTEPTAPSVTDAELIGRLFAIRTLLAQAKDLYAEQDSLVLELRARDCVRFADPAGSPEESFEIVDNFATTNVVFRPAGVKRFELREVKAPSKRARKEAA